MPGFDADAFEKLGSQFHVGVLSPPVGGEVATEGGGEDKLAVAVQQRRDGVQGFLSRTVALAVNIHYDSSGDASTDRTPMYHIDPTRTDLAVEFKARPFGVHSAELNALLLRMRGAPIEGKHVLVMTKPQAEWVLAEMTGDPPRPRPISERVFTNLAEAEWHVFKLRWERLTGNSLDID